MFSLRVVLISQDLLKLIELVLNDLCAHGITDTIAIDEDMVRELSVVVVSVSLEG